MISCVIHATVMAHIPDEKHHLPLEILILHINITFVLGLI